MRRALVILLAFILDLRWGDPPNKFHPVVLMGRWLTWGRYLAPPRHRFWFGAGWTLLGVAMFALPWLKTEKSLWQPESRKTKAEGSLSKTKYLILSPLAFILPSFLLKPIFAYHNLRHAVASVAEKLAVGDLTEARRLVSWHLVSRDTRDLSPAEVAGAAIESLAENLTDSLVAPLFAYALGGLPAAWTYRFVNTADAMWGYRTPEFEQLGKLPARLDDLLNWLPARLAGWLLVLAAKLAGEDANGAARTMLTQHQRTPSPNAGWTMSAIAGALGVTLNKREVYTLAGGSRSLDHLAIYRALHIADLGAGLCLILITLLAIWRDHIGLYFILFCARIRK